jgi:putative DNA primase/helicase
MPHDSHAPIVPTTKIAEAQSKWGTAYRISAGDAPVIAVKAGERHLAADQGAEALIGAGVPFYQRAGRLVRIASIKAKNCDGETFLVPGIVTVTSAILERALGQSATWQRFDKRSEEYVRIDPPRAVASQIRDMADYWPFPPLSGIIQCPTLRRGGTLFDTEGYDEATALVLVSSLAMPAVTVRPTRADAMTALDLLLGLLAEFPFDGDASRSVALSMLMTPGLRSAMSVAPMHLTKAPAPGTGKSYLADCASMIATGDRCPVEAASPSAEETEKRLVGSALDGHPIIALDNCRDILEGDFLCQITERPLLKLRALGKSTKYRIPNTFTFFANGNNVAVAEDMVRRTIAATMDANLESPESREFKMNPLAMIKHDRGKYVAAILTIARAYVAADGPNPLPPLASFEEWSRLVREPLVWLGRADPVKTMSGLRQADPKAGERHTVFAAWKSEIGVGRNRACRTAELIEIADSRPNLFEALLVIAPQRFGTDQKINPQALGIWLGRYENTIASGCKLMVDRTDATRPRWYLEFVA